MAVGDAPVPPPAADADAVDIGSGSAAATVPTSGDGAGDGGDAATLQQMVEMAAFLEERQALEAAAIAAGFAPPDEADGDGYDSTGGVEDAAPAHRAGRLVLVRSEEFSDAVEEAEEHE